MTAWGYNTVGQTNVPAGLSNVVNVAAGHSHNLALKADGTVTAWGHNNYGQTNVPAGLNHVVAVAAGQYHSMVLKADGISAANLSPIRRWVADTLAGSDGSSVSSWTDAIGGKNATQVTAGKRPRLYSNALNGHKVVRFTSGSSQHLTVTSADSPISAAGSFSLVMVFKTSTPGNSSSLFYQNTGLLGCEQPNPVADWAFCLNGTRLGAGLGAGASGCGADFSLYGGNVTDGNPHIALCVRAGETITLYVDGVRVATQTSLCTAARGNYSFQIGAMTTSSYFFNGDIAEIQLYNRALNSWEIMSINEVLAATYGVGGAAGPVVVWGDNASGQANVPKGLTNVLAVAGGSAFNLALNPNGTAAAWGNNGQGQTNLPAGLTNVSAIAGGLNFGLALGNQPPRANNATVSGFVDHDLLITLPVSNPDGNPLAYRILSLPAAGALFQDSGGIRGAPINVTNAVLSDPAGRLVFAPAAGATGDPYAGFYFMADDGLFGSGAGQVTVNIALPSAPQFTSWSWPQGNPSESTFDLRFVGDASATYSLWATTNLMHWERIGTAAEPSPGQYQFIDATAAGQPRRFYRASAGQ